jgi:ATP-dependent DNA helicase PIF1
LADFETKTEVEVAKVDLTLCQEKALVMLNGADNVFLTGVAGSGKSFLIQHFLKGKNPKSNPIVASTGAAAVLVHGVTFHSFFSLGRRFRKNN